MKAENMCNNLKRLRGNKTQLELCEELKINLRNYQRMESENPPDIRLSTILKLLNYYDITLEELLK